MVCEFFSSHNDSEFHDFKSFFVCHLVNYSRDSRQAVYLL